MRTARQSFITTGMIGTDLSVNQTSKPVPTDQSFGSAFQISWSGSFTGTFALQASISQLQSISNVAPVFSQISGSKIQVTAGLGPESGTTFLWNYSGALYEQMRLVYVRTSGSGTLLTAEFLIKGF